MKKPLTQESKELFRRNVTQARPWPSWEHFQCVGKTTDVAVTSQKTGAHCRCEKGVALKGGTSATVGVSRADSQDAAQKAGYVKVCKKIENTGKNSKRSQGDYPRGSSVTR